MRKRASIEFELTSEISAPILKFGGEPFGLPNDLWPHAKAKSEPMQFICQIPFGPDLFPGTRESMAYLFLTVSDGESATWKPDGGENRVVILPMNRMTSTLTIGDAPRLSPMVKKWWHKWLTPEVCVFEGKLSVAEDPDFVPEDLLTQSLEERNSYLLGIGGNKLGACRNSCKPMSCLSRNHGISCSNWIRRWFPSGSTSGMGG